MTLPPSLGIDAAGARVRLSPTDPAFVADPYPAYAAIRQACPVFLWEDYGFPCLAGHADVAAALRDRRLGRQILHLVSRADLGWPEPKPHLEAFDAVERHSLLELEPPAHTRLRGLVNRAFVSRAIERLRPRIASLAHDLLDGVEGAGEADLIAAFAQPIPVVVIAELLGVPVADAPDLVSWSHAMVAMYRLAPTRAEEDAAAAASAAFAAYLRRLIAERRAEPRDDLLSHLVRAETEGERLTEDEIVSTAILLLNAGHEATVHAIGNAAAAILRNGADPAGLFADEAATAGAVEEALRLDPPLHLFTRYALEDLELFGLQLKRGERIGLLLGAANRDPSVFPEPGRFDPARPNALAHLAFGAGIHFCLGAPLARLEMQVALPILFRRLPRLALAEPPRYRDSYHFRGLEALRVIWGGG